MNQIQKQELDELQSQLQQTLAPKRSIPIQPQQTQAQTIPEAIISQGWKSSKFLEIANSMVSNKSGQLANSSSPQLLPVD